MRTASWSPSEHALACNQPLRRCRRAMHLTVALAERIDHAPATLRPVIGTLPSAHSARVRVMQARFTDAS